LRLVSGSHFSSMRDEAYSLSKIALWRFSPRRRAFLLAEISVSTRCPFCFEQLNAHLILFSLSPLARPEDGTGLHLVSAQNAALPASASPRPTPASNLKIYATSVRVVHFSSLVLRYPLLLAVRALKVSVPTASSLVRR